MAQITTDAAPGAPRNQSRPMRILEVLRAPVGGLMRHVADLGEGLSAKGHLVGLVVGEPGSQPGGLAALAPQFALGVHTVPLPHVLGIDDLLASRRLRRLMADLDVDIIHGHGAKGGFHARLAGNGRVPVFYTPHGGVLHYAPKSLKGKLFYWAERQVLARTTKILFESEFARTSYSDAIADPGDKGTVIYNGLRAAEFAPLGSTGEFKFGFVGELRKLKGVDVLLEAIGRLAATGNMPTVLVAGDGPDRLEFEAKARGGNVPKSVVFSGFQPAANAFARADCIVVPSRRESLPYVVLEAAAAGKPLIATQTGGMAEIFGPTRSRLIEPGQIGALANEMTRWLTTPDELIAEAEIRRQHVQKTFRLDTMVAAIEGVYLGAINQK